MLAMSDELGPDNSLLWDNDDDQSWSFSKYLGGHEDDDCTKELPVADITIPEGQAAPPNDEEAPPPPPPPPPPLPPLPVADKKKKKRSGGGGDDEGKGGGGDSDHELHIWTERERRKKMRNMFSGLHALLPHLPPKADKSTIVDEAVNHIKKLQQTLENLQKLKLERFHGLMINHNPMINYHDPSTITHKLALLHSREAFLAEQGSTSNTASANPPFPGPDFPAFFRTWTSANVVLNVCWKDAHFSICCPKKPGLLTAICFVMEKHKLDVLSAQVESDRNRCMFLIHARANGASDQFQQAFPVEEIYKQAAAEIMLFLNS